MKKDFMRVTCGKMQQKQKDIETCIFLKVETLEYLSQIEN